MFYLKKNHPYVIVLDQHACYLTFSPGHGQSGQVQAAGKVSFR